MLHTSNFLNNEMLSLHALHATKLQYIIFNYKKKTIFVLKYPKGSRKGGVTLQS